MTFTRHVATVGALCALMLVPAAAGAANVNKKVSKLKQQVKALQQQVDELEREPGPSTGPAGGDLAGSYPNPLIANGAVGSSEILDGQIGTVDQAVIPAADVRQTGAETVPDNSTEALNFDSERFDTANLHDNATNNSLLTAPVSGLYLFTGEAAWSNDPDNDEVNHRLDIFSSVLAQTSGDGFNQTTSPRQQVTAVMDLDAGESAEMRARQDNADNDSLTVDARFTMTWLGPGP